MLTRPWLAMYCASKHAVVANTRSGESERNRPDVLRDPGETGVSAQQMQAMEQAFRALLATGLPPEQVADAVVDAIRNERFYIITHEEMKDQLSTRLGDIIGGGGAARPAAPPPRRPAGPPP